MNNSVFGKTMENVRNHRDIKVVTTDKWRSILASEPKYHSSKCILKDLMIMEMKKVEVKINKLIYLGYMDTDSFVMHVKTRFLQRYCRWCWKMVWYI